MTEEELNVLKRKADIATLRYLESCGEVREAERKLSAAQTANRALSETFGKMRAEYLAAALGEIKPAEEPVSIFQSQFEMAYACSDVAGKEYAWKGANPTKEKK